MALACGLDKSPLERIKNEAQSWLTNRRPRQMSADAIANRIDRSMSRLDAASGALAIRLQQQIRADAAAEAEQERDRLRRDAALCAKHQRKYDDLFQRFNKRAPEPRADDDPPDYRRQLFRIGQTMLPSGHELTGFDPRELNGSAIIPFEKQLFDALAKEAEEPSGDNLPQTVDDPRAKRERTDDMGAKFIEYRARSFITDMGRRGMRVAAVYGKNGDVIYPLRLREALAFR
jgi:hypothetical protein